MAESMAMSHMESDQEQNWIYGHMVTFGHQLLGQDGQGREVPTRLTKCGAYAPGRGFCTLSQDHGHAHIYEHDPFK
jgi:hypothetical protein